MSIALARKFRVDVTSDLTLASGWTQVFGITDLNPEITPDLQDASDYTTNGWGKQEVTMQNWTLEMVFNRQVNSGVYDPGQELVRARVGQFGTSARVGVRWYDNTGGPEAYSGVALVDWKRSNTKYDNLEAADVTLSGTDQALNIGISNPYSTALAPVITAVTPSGVGTGGAVLIQGVYFTGTVGASHVTIGGTNATSYTVQNDNLITAVLPSGSAGSANIIVTNAVGASNTFAYTRAV